MKLLTQNLIKCQAGDCSTADISSEPSPYPLKLTIETSENEKTEDFYSFNAKVKMLKSLDWNAFVQTVEEAEFKDNNGFKDEERKLPKELEEGWDKDEEFVNRVFETAMGKEVLTGSLKCKRCDREYRIVNGIVNLLLKEDEIEDGEEKKEEV